MLYVLSMSTASTDNLPRKEALKMAVELRMPLEGTLYKLRQRLKREWKAIG